MYNKKRYKLLQDFFTFSRLRILYFVYSEGMMTPLPSLSSVNYYYITDERLDISPQRQVEIAIENGVRMVQYRNKNSTSREMYEEAKAISQICDDRAIFIVNDRLDIALTVDAHGVHLGQEDIPPSSVRAERDDIIIGVSTHNLEQAMEAQEIADYIGIGPVHSTKTKRSKYRDLGVDGVRKIARLVDVPTAAIGGIQTEDIEPLAQDLDMICAISSVTQSGNLTEMIARFENDFLKAKRCKHD